MYRNFLTGKLFLLAAVPAIIIGSCTTTATNSALNNDDDRGGYASDASRIEFANNDVISLADQAGTLYNAEYIRALGSTCATVASDTINLPHSLIIRFGETDCICADGRARRGSIVITYYGRYSDTGQLHNITFNNYYLNGNQLNGSLKVTRVDTTVVGDWFYRVQVNDSMDVDPDPLQTKNVVWTGNLVRKWVGGDLTNDRSDDYFSVSGEARLTRPNGHVFNFNIGTPLQFAISCDYAQSGVVNVVGYTGTRVLNYGSGGCDNAAQVNIGTDVSPITMSK